MPLDPCSPGKWFPTEFIDSTFRLAQSLGYLTGMVGCGCLASAQLACAPPLPGEQRGVSEALLATCSPATQRTSPAPVILPFACLPTEQSRRERPPKQGWLCLQQAPWDGRAWGPGTEPVSPLQHLAHCSLEPALGSCHHPGGSPGTVRELGHQAAGLTRGMGAVGCQVVDAPCPGPTHWDTSGPSPWAGGRVAVSSPGCLRQSPASRPLHLPTEPDAALWEIPSGVCCLSPPSRHPQWRRCVRINGKSLHKYLKKRQKEEEQKNCPQTPRVLNDYCQQVGARVFNVHQSAAQSQLSSQGQASSGAASTQGPLS